MTASLYDQLLTSFLRKIHSLGLNEKPVSLQALLDANMDSVDDISIVWQEHSDTTPIKLRSVLADVAWYSGNAVVNAETGFHIVGPDESVIFISSAAEGKFNRL